MDVGHEILDQLEWHWSNHLRPRLDGLTDDEWLWEPVDGCWTVHPQPDGTATIDFAFPEPTPPPVTTIAWRLGHIACGIFAVRASAHFGDGSVTLRDLPVAVDRRRCAAPGRRGPRRLGRRPPLPRRRRLGGAVRPRRGPVRRLPDGRPRPCTSTVRSIHHGAEVLLLRDLYRHRR